MLGSDTVWVIATTFVGRLDTSSMGLSSLSSDSSEGHCHLAFFETAATVVANSVLSEVFFAKHSRVWWLLCPQCQQDILSTLC
jgi:hypothetical protein